jgi:capsid protein
VNNSKEILSKTVSDKFSEQATQSKTIFENLNNSLKENIEQLNQRQDKQDNEIKFLKMIAIAITIISIIGTIGTIIVLKKP